MIERIKDEINEKGFSFCNINYCVGYRNNPATMKRLYVYNELYMFFMDVAYQITLVGNGYHQRTFLYNFPRAEKNKVNGYNLHNLFDFKDPTETCERVDFYDSLEEFERLLLLENIYDWTSMDWYKTYKNTLDKIDNPCYNVSIERRQEN